MKVKELIELLQHHSAELEVMIQQGEECDYMSVYSVKEREVIYNELEEVKVLAIEYT